MNRIAKYIFLTFAPVVFMMGCHGDLDIRQDNKLSADNMWEEESDAVSATYGIYMSLRSTLKATSDSYLCWGEFRNGLWGPGTHGTLSAVYQTQVYTSSMTTTNTYADWTKLYQTINQANLVIKHTPHIDMTSSGSAFCLGNAHFVRAWCYFWIGRIWGAASLALTGYDSYSDEMYLSRAPVESVMEQVWKDLLKAEEYVADTSDKYMATPAAVKMLIADYALWMYSVLNGGEEYLNLAASAIETLGLEPGKLESRYADIFSSSSKAGREVIFAVFQSVDEVAGGPAYYLSWNSNYIDKAYQDNPVPITGGNQWWWYTDKYKQLIKSDLRDTRAELTCRSANYGVPDYTGQLGLVEWTDKSVGQLINGVRVFDSDYILYRYGEAFLLDAEIKYLREDYPGALTSLNVVAARAYGIDNYYTNTAPEAVRRAIIDENLKELVAEGRTWWMLIRMGAVSDYNRYIAEKLSANPNILLWPITQDTMNRNSNLTQTQGW